MVSTTERGDTLVLGGVFNMQALLIPGQPYGVIQGTAPLRDPNGELYVNPITGRLITQPHAADYC